MIVIEGGGRTSDKSAELIAALMDAIDEHCEGLSVVTVLGCVEVVKILVLQGEDEE